MVTALVLEKETGFANIPSGVWYATYDPEESKLDLGFSIGFQGGAATYVMCQKTSKDTGATWFTLDGTNHTVESLAGVGKFSIPLTDYLTPQRSSWVHAQENLKPLESWLTARGDTASAQKLRETFPKVFAPPSPSPQLVPPVLQPQSRRRWWQRK